MDRVAPSVRRRADRHQSLLLLVFFAALALLLALTAVLAGRVAGNTPGGIASSLARNTDGFGECRERGTGGWRCSTWGELGASGADRWEVIETGRGCWSGTKVAVGGEPLGRTATGCVTALDFLDGQDDFATYP